MSNAFSHISNPGLLTPETPGTATLKFGRTNPRRPYDNSVAHHYHRYTHNPRHHPEHYPGHYPGHHARERIGRIDRIWSLILGGVGGSSPIAFPSVLVDHEYQKNRKKSNFLKSRDLLKIRDFAKPAKPAKIVILVRAFADCDKITILPVFPELANPDLT